VLAALLVAGVPAAEKNGDLRPLPSTAWGTLRGKITLEGMPPAIEERNKAVREAMAKHADREHCLSAKAPREHTEHQAWRVGKDGGLANVFVWLKPPPGTYFKIDPKKRTWPQEVVLDQPYCAFEPHALVLFPSYVNPDNPTTSKGTAQQFIVRNSAPMNHNVNYRGGPENPGESRIILPGKQLRVELEPSAKEVVFKCDIHPWMSAYVRAFDHPYATVSGKDGTYEINNVPAGAEVRVVVWHEVAGYVEGEEGKSAKMKAGENVLDFRVKAK
jgi:hypothetical protein